MGTERCMVLFTFFLLLTVPVRTQRTKTEFTFRGFTGNQSEILTTEAAMIKPDGLLRLTDRNSNVTGTGFYRRPVRLLESIGNSTSQRVRSFSTCFVFVIIPTSSSNGGFGFTFTLSPTPDRPGAASAQYLGFLNEQNDGNPTNHVFAVEFDTVQGFKDGEDRIGNHIGLNFNSLTSDFQEPVVYYDSDDPNRKEDFSLQSGDPIRAHLDYDGPTQTLNFTVYPADLKSKPIKPLISRQIPKLLEIVQEEMYVGFTAATGRDQSSAHYVMGWSFSSGGANPVVDTLDLSELPPAPPNTAKTRGYDPQVLALIVALSGVTLILLALLFFFAIYKKRLQQGEILEDWEINHPHRLRYKDLYAATDGFKESRIIGTGGFGTVFRGSISTPSSDQIAVKKITPNSMQGVREFVAEIESLGRLRHKNLVNLRGWCKHKNDLLLIYDYIPNGSLDSLLYSRPRQSGAVLSWNARFQIVSGRRPTDSGTFFLADWVMELRASGEILPAVDPRLGSGYDRGEAKLALSVGLLCCHQRPASRPSMRMVLRYLNGDEDVPEIDDHWGYSDYSRSDSGSKFEGYVSSDKASSSVASFSITRISSSSVMSGR
ncbi:unnamed protein product [Thlaspi arvense]|uniref:Protein kinase domain-containing protein n=1 Tax=Thlaspi arvense TaxID=13288 RepID=A0AAU9SWW5_THLAR|nr:unnamed protein product [Thlaspi arvense]